MYKLLKRLRVASSVAFLLLLSLAIADAAVGATPVGHWLLEVQLVPAILAGSTIWIVLWVLVTLTFGRVYCSSVCPLGTMQDAAARLGRKCSRGAGKRYQYRPPLTGLRITIPIVVAACLFAGFVTIVAMTDPYAVYARMVYAVCRPAAMGFGSLALTGLLFLVINFAAYKRGRLVCNTICPAGALLGFMSRQSIYRVDINTDKCIHCGKCAEVCKSECIDLRTCVVDNSRCVMCFDCTAVCPNDAITVRRGRYKLSTPMMQQITN